MTRILVGLVVSALVCVMGFYGGLQAGVAVEKCARALLLPREVAKHARVLFFLLIAVTSFAYAFVCYSTIRRPVKHESSVKSTGQTRQLEIISRFRITLPFLMLGLANAAWEPVAPIYWNAAPVVIAVLWGYSVALDLGPRLQRISEED